MQNYTTKHTSMVSQCAMGSNSSRVIRLNSAIYEFATLHKKGFQHYLITNITLFGLFLCPKKTRSCKLVKNR